jgi:hypothetical protein
MVKQETIKKIIAVVLIVVAGGGWLYLDYLNKKQLQEAEEMRRSMEQAHMQALARARAIAEAKEKFKAQILVDLVDCKAAAEKAKEDFLTLNQKPVRGKPGKFAIPQTALDEGTKSLEAANAACQATYGTRLNGY